MTIKKRTRAKILETAEDFFITNGYNDTSIIDIAQAIKVDRRTIYRYFASKEIILLTIVKSMYDDFVLFLSSNNFSENSTAFEKIRELFQKYLFYFKKNFNILLTISMLDTNLTNKTRDKLAYQNFIETTKVPDQILIELIQEGVLDGSLNNVCDIETTAITINNALLSLASRVSERQSVLDKEQNLESWKMLETLGEIILKGIKNGGLT